MKIYKGIGYEVIIYDAQEVVAALLLLNDSLLLC